MTTHITLRLAWHNDGWNGKICQNPAKNTYCVGCSSYPGEMIRESRDLEWENINAGKAFNKLDKPPACMYSGNTFSETESPALSEPPDFFKSHDPEDNTQIAHWTLPKATACTWPYEAMYNVDGIKKENSYDYALRLEGAEEHFKPVEAGKSLVFYYANYSNPLSDDETPVYLLVGVARIKEISPILYYEGSSKKILERYKGFIWQRGITSHYPEQGLRLPYHLYQNRQELMRKFAVIPENASLCKYATKHVTDDEALGLLEQLLESLRILRDDIKDNSENWDARIQWLEGLVAELWKSRGAYPGMPAVLEFLGIKEAIDGFKSKVVSGFEQKAVEETIAFCNSKTESVNGYKPDKSTLKTLRRSIALQADNHLDLLLTTISRCAINVDQLKAIMDEKRINVGLTSSLDEIKENIYLLAEQYSGKDQRDCIRWSMIDRGALPSPELPAKPLFEKNAPERIRALLLETLRRNKQQTFIKSSLLLEHVNMRIASQPEWKQNLLAEKYLKVDREFYDHAIYQREEEGYNYLYDLHNWNDEREIQKIFDDLLIASDIQLPKPVNEEFWHKVLYREQSTLATKTPNEYKEAITSQTSACKQIINKRLAAITGGAGTGKSTVVAALIKAIKKIHGEGTGVAVITPTGKASDRIRKAFKEVNIEGVPASTIHSILAKFGWLNKNMTFKRSGGNKITEYNTIIIDESSMIDLSLMAVLFRAIDWNSIKRLILVGDAAQLPPIGTGKVYADVVSYIRESYPEHFCELTVNLRQMENRATGKGNGILKLASCFINGVASKPDEDVTEKSIDREILIQNLHEGGEIDKDLRVVYWSEPEKLASQLIHQITEDLAPFNNGDKTSAQILGEALKANINVMQILSPVRSELFGTESINTEFQKLKSEYWLKRGNIDGITLFDKVIQIRNRPKSDPLHGYDFEKKETVEVDIYNGEIGSVVPSNGAEWKKIKWSGYRLKSFSVQFSGKDKISVNYYGRTYDKPESNLELAYAISVHKSQGSEFQRVYFVLPSVTSMPQKMELVYTALTRAVTHCTIFVQNNVESFINAMRPEQSALKTINSSLFKFAPVNDMLLSRSSWYEAGKIHKVLAGDMVRSKSEVIIANMLHERGITFWYEKPLVAPDGTMYLPDFTLMVRGEEYYWEHLGMLENSEYSKHWNEKEKWYAKHYAGHLETTTEGSDLSDQANTIINSLMNK